MFAEEEWTDVTPVNGPFQTAGKAEHVHGKHTVISKHFLKRTLQSLDSAHGREQIKTADEEAAPHPWKKQKLKCRKQKKPLCTGINSDVNKEAVTRKKPVKKQQAKYQVDTDCTKQDKITRQQWKNKMKNRRRCRNKFLVSSAAELKLEDDLRQMQDLSEAPAKNKLNVSISTGMIEKVQTITVKENTHKPILTEPVWEGSCQRPVKGDKKMQKKLQSVLNIQATETDKGKRKRNCEQEKYEPLKDSECQMDRSSALRSRMEKRLESARFRYINELLYTSTSGEAKRIFQHDPDAIKIYHKGYSEQVKHWPANPVDTIISYLRKRSSSLVIADFGCGDCKIARSVNNKVHCFDLAPVCDMVTVCDMANVPLGDSTVDIAVFCLSLMGTNRADFLAEANRVLVMGGVLKIAEVASRFDNLRQFAGSLSCLGFKLVSKDTSNSHFYSFEFLKTNNAIKDVKKIGLELKPCVYKKR